MSSPLVLGTVLSWRREGEERGLLWLQPVCRPDLLRYARACSHSFIHSSRRALLQALGSWYRVSLVKSGKFSYSSLKIVA